jgi:hypothetical protein
MVILAQFALRLSYGLALSMALTSPRKVTSGYFRNHAYVLLGLTVLATLVTFAGQANGMMGQYGFVVPLVAAVLSYLCSAVWLYEKHLAGIVLLALVAASSLAGAWLDQSRIATATESTGLTAATILHVLDPVTGGLLLGSTIAAMFLGHWYLNTPTMELAPLQRLLKLMAVAVVARAVVCGVGLGLQWQEFGLSSTDWWFVALRWAAGLVGTAVLIWMTWQTLKIPNTQSATGILYVAVIATFLGELTAGLLSAGTVYPL